MPSLISNTERQTLGNLFNDVFDTFSRVITVYKEPIKTLINSDSSNFIFGFGESQNADAYSYSQVTGVFPAKIRYNPQNKDYETNTSAYIDDGTASIKVRQDCRDFINNGKTEKIVFDDKTFILDSEEKKRVFLDSQYYVFILRLVQ